MTPRLMFLSADLFHVIPFTFNLQKAYKIVPAVNTVKVSQHSPVLLKELTQEHLPLPQNFLPAIL